MIHRYSLPALACLSLSLSNPAFAQEQPAPAAPPPVSDETIVKPNQVDPQAAVAELLGVSSSEATKRLVLQEAAANWAADLAANPPAGFVDIDIEHSPRFVVNVYFTREVSASELTRLAPNALNPFVRIKRVKKSLAEIAQDREAIVKALSEAGIEYALYSDLRTEKIVIALFNQQDKNRALELLPPTIRPDIRFEQGRKTLDVGSIYSGNWFQSGGSSGGLCTMGFPMRNSQGRDGLITAAHCNPRNPYISYVDNGVFLGAPYAAYLENYYGKTYDFAIYLLGSHTTGPYTYVDNNVTYNGFTNNVPGFADGYYDITDVIPTASQVRGYLMCKNGGRSGFSCGEILSTSYDEPARNIFSLVQVGNSAQPTIAAQGDSGGPIFTYPNGVKIRAAGIMKSTSQASDGSVCQNSRSCFFTYMPLSYARSRETFTVNTSSGFKVP